MKKSGGWKAGDEGRGPVILQGPPSVGSLWQQSNQTRDSVLKGRGYKTCAAHTQTHKTQVFSDERGHRRGICTHKCKHGRGDAKRAYKKAATAADGTRGTRMLHNCGALKNPRVSHYSRLRKNYVGWRRLGDRSQCYSSSQSSSERLGSGYELSHCNKRHLATGSLAARRLCKQDTQKHHYRGIGNKA